MKSYTLLRQSRENFRKRLVELIIGKRETDEIDPDNVPNSQEREVLRYYYYIQQGIDTVHVSPMDEKLLQRVLTPKFLTKVSIK